MVTPLEVLAQEATVTPTPTDTVQTDATPTPTPTDSVSPTETPAPTDQPTVTPADTSTPTPALTETPAPTNTPTPTETQSAPVQLVAYVYTDQSDYSPTQKVLIYGKDFSVNEGYTVKVSSTDEPAVEAPLSVTTDAAGSFSTAYQLDGNYRPNYAVAVVDGSGNTVATTTFTDSTNKVGTVTVGAQSGSLTAGTAGSATYLITVNSNGGAFTANLTLPSLPSGVTGSFTSSSLSFLGSDHSKSTTLTLTTTAAAAATAGTFFTVTATNATQASDHQSGNGTLTINAGPSDVTPPVTTDDSDGAWHNGNVTVHFNCTDAGSGCAHTYYTTDGSTPTVVSSTGSSATLSAEGVYTIKYFSVDNAGNTESVKTAINQVKIDKTKPVITGSALPAPVDDWNNTNVTVSFVCADTGATQSGIAANTVAGAILSTDGAGQSVTNSGSCTDNAGNVANSASVSGINIDETAPTDPTDVSSTDHIPGIPSSNNVVTMAWTVAGSVPGATDATSGVDGYSYSFTNGATDEPSAVKVAEETATSTSSALTDGTWYFHLRTKDNAGNWTDTVHVGSFIIDTVPPVTTDDADAAWHNTNVTVHFTCTDTGSGCATTYYTTNGSIPTILSASGNSVTLTTDGIYTIKYFSVDNAGNQETVETAANQVHIDKTKPVITITTPIEGGSYILNHVVLANYGATDIGGSGVSSVVGDVPNGSAIDTTSTGPHTFTVTATDIAGNVQFKTVTYNVEQYNIVKLPPITLDSKTFKQTSTIPVKIVLTTTSGAPVTDGTALLYYAAGNISDLTLVTTPATSSGGSNVLNKFRNDPTSNQYIFNLSTKPLTITPTAKTYTLKITLDTGQLLQQVINLK